MSTRYRNLALIRWANLVATQIAVLGRVPLFNVSPTRSELSELTCDLVGLLLLNTSRIDG